MKRRTVIAVFSLVSVALLGAALLLYPHRKVTPSIVHADPFAVTEVTVSEPTATFLTLTPSAQGSVRIYSVSGFCLSLQATNVANMQMVTNPNTAGNVLLWETAPGDITTSLSSFYWTQPFQFPAGVPAGIQIASCANGTNYILNVQYSSN